MLLDLADGKRRKAINITPLIDIVFILLLFFMLSSNFQHWRQVDLSSAEKKQSDPDSKNIRIVKILNDRGSMLFDGTAIAMSDQLALQRLVVQEPLAVYAIEAARGVQTQSVIQVLDVLKQQGATHVSLAGVLP